MYILLSGVKDPDYASPEFLFTDIDVAMTFLDVAEATRINESVTRNKQNARRAYDAVSGLLGKLTLNADDRQRVETKLVVLKARLEAVGQQF